MSISQAEIDLLENQEFQRRTWKAQRWAWVILALFIALAALGMTGSAWLTRRVAKTSEGQIDWPAFGRQGTTFELNLNFRSPGTSFWVSNELLRSYEVVGVSPRPVEESGDATRVYFRPAVAPISRNTASQGPRIRVWLKPTTAGWVTGDLGIGDSDPVHLEQFVYF